MQDTAQGRPLYSTLYAHECFAVMSGHDFVLIPWLFVQTGDSFEFALRLCGHASIWETCSNFVVDKEAGILHFPVKVRMLLPVHA